MRIGICDYSGHPFQVQLSRELARRGHTLLHLHFAEFLTPKGRLAIEPTDPATFNVEGVSLGQPFAKDSLIRRRFQEVEIGRRFAARLAAFGPDVVIGCNLPIDALLAVVKSCRRARRPFVFWQQDVYSSAIKSLLDKRFGLIGRAIGAYYQHLEAKAVALSSAIVVITQDFVDVIKRDLAADPRRIHIIENWAPLDEIAPRDKSNGWAREQGLDRTQVALYTGTLGLKHDPSLILDLASKLRRRPNTLVVVVSEGLAATWLAAQARERGLASLRVLPFQPFNRYSDVLASADVLIAMVEPDAGFYSVPSKILSYLCAERAIVLSSPPQNLASRVVGQSGGGTAVPTTDRGRFVDEVLRLLDDPAERAKLAQKGRAYAESTFDIAGIANKFEVILNTCTAG